MIILLLIFVFVAEICQGKLDRKVRGANCLKVGDSVYVLGGEVFSDVWTPLEYVYSTKLDSMRHSDLSGDIWTQENIKDYSPPGLNSAATVIPGTNKIVYFGIDQLKAHEVWLKQLDTEDKTTIALESRPFELNWDFSSDNEVKPNRSEFSLIANDIKDTDLILMGGKSTNRKGHYENEFSLYDIKSKSWKSYSSDIFTSHNYISVVNNGSLYVFGPGINFDKIPDSYRIPEDKKDSILLLGKFDLYTKRWEAIISVGVVPNFELEYSVAQEEHIVFLFGKKNDTISMLYLINPSSAIPQWWAIELSELTSFEFGCLTYHDDKIIHYFGTENTKGIQILDLNDTLSEVERDQSSDVGSGPILISIILGSLSGLLTLILSVAITCYLIRRKKKLRPPDIYQELIICEPQFDLMFNKPQLTNSNNQSHVSDSQLFTINELNPEECFINRIIWQKNL